MRRGNGNGTTRVCMSVRPGLGPESASDAVVALQWRQSDSAAVSTWQSFTDTSEGLGVPCDTGEGKRGDI